MNKILVVSHCILNTSTKVVSYNQEEIREETANREKLLNYVLKNKVQLLQLPCPEFLVYGSNRWGHVKDQYSHSFFRKQCRDMLQPVILQLCEYAVHPDRFEVMAIVAINGSPNCGYQLTCKGDWGGEFTDCPDFDNKISSLSMAKESGVFMEEMVAMLKEQHIDIPIKDLVEITEELGI